MNHSTKKTALVTGASGGIGCELGREFAREGYGTVLVARSGDRLERVAGEIEQEFGTPARAFVTDLADPDAPCRLYEQFGGGDDGIDVLVNNAGFGTVGPFAESRLEDELEQLQVNVVALTHLTGLFLPSLVRRRGGILNVASTAAFQPGPLMAVYYASKAYVLSFSEALSEEVRGSGVTVTALCPGPTATDFQARARMTRTRLASGAMMDAGSVARAGLKGFLQGRRVVIPGVGNRVLAGSVRFAPRRWVMRLVRHLNDNREGH